MYNGTVFLFDNIIKRSYNVYMIKNYNLGEVKQNIDMIAWSESDKYMDGFVTWGCKQELYQILWYVEDKLEKCSTYTDEEDYVKRRDQEKMLQALGKNAK